MAAKRWRVILPEDVPTWEVVVLASDYDALWTRCQELQDRYDRLKYSTRRDTHDQHCEQEGGDPYCSCFKRAVRRTGQEGRGDGE